MDTAFTLVLAFLFATFLSAPSRAAETVTFSPVTHASFVIQGEGKVVYVDPTGDIASYAGQSAKAVVLVTHEHQDHFAPELLTALRMRGADIYGPKSVIEKLGFGEAVTYGDLKKPGDIRIEVVPAYNTTPEKEKFHPKGRDNGYVVTMEGKRIYISGDTEDISQVKTLKKIDYAFVCMNQPYTMSVEQAASLVLEQKPKVVIPYHYRGPDGMSDLGKFKELVSKEKGIEVRELKWY